MASTKMLVRRTAYVVLNLVVVVFFSAIVTLGLISVLIPLGVIGGSWVWMALVSGLSLAMSIILLVPVAPRLYRRLWVTSGV
jgi:hypothetical protein